MREPKAIIIPVIPGERMDLERIGQAIRGNQNNIGVQAVVQLLEMEAARTMGDSRETWAVKDGLTDYFVGGNAALADVLGQITDILENSRSGEDEG